MMTAFCDIFVEGTDLLDVGEENVSCETYCVNCGKVFQKLYEQTALFVFASNFNGKILCAIKIGARNKIVCAKLFCVAQKMSKNLSKYIVF